MNVIKNTVHLAVAIREDFYDIAMEYLQTISYNLCLRIFQLVKVSF
jgi:hypothetical protein